MKDILKVLLYGALCFIVRVATQTDTLLTNTTQTGTSQTDTTEAFGISEWIDTSQADKSQPDTASTTYTTKTDTGTSQNKTTQTGTSQADTTEAYGISEWIDTSQADKSQPDTASTTYTTKTDTSQNKTTQTDTSQADTTEAYTTQRATSPTDTTKVDTTQTDTTRTTYTTQTDTSQNKVTLPYTTRDDISHTSTPQTNTHAYTTHAYTTKRATSHRNMSPTNRITTETQNTDEPGTTDKWYKGTSAYVIFSIGVILLAIIVFVCVWFLYRRNKKWKKMSVIGAGQRVRRWSQRFTQTFDANSPKSEDSDDEEISHPNQITMSSFTKNGTGISNGVANENTKDEERGVLDNTVSKVGVNASSLEQPSSVIINEMNEKDEKIHKSDDVTTDAAESKEFIDADVNPSGRDLLDVATSKDMEGDVADDEVNSYSIQKNDDDEKPSGGDLLDVKTSKDIEGDVADEKVNNSSLQRNDDDNTKLIDGEQKSEEVAPSE
ncbi:serine-rich adhesin for platelets-like isoform X2 [Anneissia japonica]|uniref:serine-rich adhesin for platelets-like isoform X2 n=1 Tax=Anneissia japonica TaxID=1529436 RepID=UPI0014259E8A|nr:serine-rich adhesin for platelets-like isoform X2 [Anneissia japonica]